MTTSRRPLPHWIVSIYRVTLWTYPPAFRRRYGREMTLAFQDQAREALGRGASALLLFLVQIGADWVRTTFREGFEMTSPLTVLRWIVALPVAMAAAVAPVRLLTPLVAGNFQHVWIVASVSSFLMAAAFVAAGVLIAPKYKDSVARIALGVVAFWSLALAVVGAVNVALLPIGWATCMLLGGVAAYTPSRRILAPRTMSENA